MTQLLAHLWGDYVLQNHWMASNKTSSGKVCLIHCLLYGVPFLFLTNSVEAIAIIVISHFLIDRYRLATWLVKLKNWTWTDNGFDSSVPAFLTVWITILVDNTLHLTINYLALNYL